MRRSPLAVVLVGPLPACGCTVVGLDAAPVADATGHASALDAATLTPSP